MTRAKGHIRDTRRAAGAIPHHKLVGAAAQLPDEVLLDDVPDDQGPFSSCTGFGYYRGAFKAWARARGMLDQAEASALAGYVGGRAIMVANADEPLVDGGCSPAAVVEFAQRYGVIPDAWLPYSAAFERVNERLAPVNLIGAARFGLAAFSVIESQREQLVDDLLVALAGRFPVSFAMQVDDAYESLEGATVYRALTGARRGGHAQRISGYRRTVDGVVFRVTGSWGPGFADGGFAWLHETFITSPETYDFYALTFAPRVGS